ncbi:MAG TPA: beta-ketoacyl-[acyl-carrier-protein] synthase family protein [Flavipsychrobacter sp.]|nr:beta-ketoacyl-[acyl-carrier-protein] synthase family protein [Flavipsychrobacter sp.]
MADNIVITAAGIVSALGIGYEANLQALRDLRHGLQHPQFLRTIHNDLLIGEVRLSDDALAESLSISLAREPYTRTSLLAITAMKELVQDIDLETLREENVAFINANTVGGMCSVEDMYMEFISDHYDGDFVKYIDTLDCAASTQDVIHYFKIRPFTATLSTACSSSSNAMIVGARMIAQGLVDKAICGGCDAMSRYTVNGFLSLKNVDKQHCKPFDQNRNGLNLGEGAAFVMLEKETAAKARGANILAHFSGYNNSNDAYHPTAPSPDGSGALRAMTQALAKARLQPQDINYINAHGTATLNNDTAEGKAIQQLFGGGVPFSSTKPFTGHTLAAAGAVEALFSMMALRENMILPNLNFETPMEELNITPVRDLITDRRLNHVISNSFGFGGNNVSLIFSKA